MTTADVIAYYQDLLIFQYHTAPKARATIAAYVGEALADQIIASVRDAFNIPAFELPPQGTAIGAQLDILAAYRGVPREVYGIVPTRSYWQMPVYGQADAETDKGFLFYGDTSQEWYFLTYDLAKQPLYALTDLEMVRLIQLRALAISGSYSVADVDAVLFDIFGPKVGVFESSPMNITYADLTADTDPLFDIAAQTKSLPRPAGVALTTERLAALANEFGFQHYGVALNSNFVGYSLYGTPRPGSFLRYF